MQSVICAFQCRTRLFPFAPTTASRSPSPARAGEAWLRLVFSQNHAILASPADAGERSTSANHTSFYSCSWDVFPYDLFPVQLCPMGLLLGHFVGGAASLPGDVEWRFAEFQCRTRLCVWCSTLFPDAKMTGKVSMPHAALCVVQHDSWSNEDTACNSFNAARGFVCGAASRNWG